MTTESWQHQRSAWITPAANPEALILNTIDRLTQHTNAKPQAIALIDTAGRVACERIVHIAGQAGFTTGVLKRVQERMKNYFGSCDTTLPAKIVLSPFRVVRGTFQRSGFDKQKQIRAFLYTNSTGIINPYCNNQNQPVLGRQS